jgi:hypothetical protein
MVNTYQSHTYEPEVGEKVLNTNKKCKHYKSKGTVLSITELPQDSGKIIAYKCTNSGDNWARGDILKKTMDQLSPQDLYNSESIIRSYVRELLREEISIIPQGEWTLLQPGDPRRDAVKEDLYSMVCDTYAPIGGHFKVCKAHDLERYTYWVAKNIDEDPDVDVAIFGKPDISGVKMGAAANDGTAKAASEYKNKSAELRAGGTISGIGNWWGEVSGKPAYAMLSRGAKAVEDESKVAELLLGDDYVFHGRHPDPEAPAIFKSVSGWYTKSFDGKSSTKIILGNPS